MRFTKAPPVNRQSSLSFPTRILSPNNGLSGGWCRDNCCNPSSCSGQRATEGHTIFAWVKPASRKREGLVGFLQKEDVWVAVVVHQQHCLYASLKTLLLVPDSRGRGSAETAEPG